MDFKYLEFSHKQDICVLLNRYKNIVGMLSVEFICLVYTSNIFSVTLIKKIKPMEC